ncbi:N-acetylmuramoyl-L-alanine amidase family protein [Bacillus sp. 03113]|uniref:peptidoglycan recognition protein family protein n=1 Tax=Bacillus sp. 03113 TaxID=2578211 RepID=UPI001144CBE6|nr:N-acetylmuramoyl-L-alanine amidase [Bacillus sp. 03113]
MAIWKEEFVIKNSYSRPGLKLLGVKGIVIHWTATPGASDEREQDFFDGADGGGGRYASAHIFIDSDSATLMIPLTEVAYHANEKPCRIPKLAATASYYKKGGANLTSIGVEMCVEKDGTIHPNTISRSIQVVAELCRMFNLTSSDIYRHHDITGKNCPAPFVRNPALFDDFKNRVGSLLTSGVPYKVIVPNTAFWQAVALVREYEGRGFKCEGVNLKQYKPNEQPQKDDPYMFVVDTTLDHAKQLVIELQTKGYGRAYGEAK